jgi:hypothetical protein
MRIGVYGAAALAFAAFCSTLPAIDLAEIEAKLAAQDAQLAEQGDVINDLRAKLEARETPEGGAESIISIQKNAKVTIGGQVNTKYTFTSAKGVQTTVAGDVGTEKHKRADFSVSDAYLNVQIDVNDYFDAYLSMDLHNGSDGDSYGIPEAYYIRWKNLCNTGFGIKIGRDALVFGADGVGELGSYAAGSGDGYMELSEEYAIPHNGWDVSGVTQITPYWEGLDGKISWELSFMQHIYNDTAYMDGGVAGTYHRSDYKQFTYQGTTYTYPVKTHSRNYGLGTISTRLAFTPIEDLTLTASLANYHSNGFPDDENGSMRQELLGPDPFADYASGNLYEYGSYRKNNTVFGLAFNYRPSSFNKLAVWGQWVHGNNVYFAKGAKSDAINFGVSYDFLENLTLFAQGDYLHLKDKRGSFAGFPFRATAWSSYVGLQYSLPYGVSFEAGWKHEWLRFNIEGDSKIKARADSIYGLVGFEF